MSRLDREDEFAVETDNAEQFFPKDDLPVSKRALRDFYDTIGHGYVRADTLRRHHPDYTAANPLNGMEEDLLDRMVHPRVFDAREAVETIKAKLEHTPVSDMKRQASLQSGLNEAITEVQERAEEIESILERVEDGDTLDAKQMSLLIDRKVEPETQRLTSMDGREFTAETSYSMGTMNGSRTFGSSAQWGPTAARRMYRDLPRRLLRRTARKVGEKPRERSVEQHIEKVGVERLLDESRHFDRQPTRLFVSDRNSTDEPRKRETPSSVLG